MRRASPPDEALTVMEDVAAKELPQGYGYEWTSIAFQEKEAGGTQGPDLRHGDGFRLPGAGGAV